MDRRHYLGLTGAGIVALFGGCSSSGDGSTATATRKETATRTATATDTATDTPTETVTEGPTETPEPRNPNFQDIYDESMAEVDAASIHGGIPDHVDTDDWDAEDLVGRSIREINDAIPGGCLIAEVGQGADAHVPNPDDTLEYGDHVTFLGDRGAVGEAVRRFHPHD